MIKRKKVLLIGGFQKAKSLTLSLLQKGYRVTAINNDYEHCRGLAEIKQLEVIFGDGSKPYILEEAGAAEMDMAIALTKRDEDNLVICELCKEKYKIPKTVSLVNDPKKMDFFYSRGINSVVCAIDAITSIIEQQAFVEDMVTRIPTGYGQICISEVAVTPAAPAAGKKLWEIALPADTVIGCILRGEQGIIPRGDTRILSGDILVFITLPSREKDVVKQLTGR